MTRPCHGLRLVFRSLSPFSRTLDHVHNVHSRYSYATVTNAYGFGAEHVPAHAVKAASLSTARNPPQTSTLPAKPQEMQLALPDDRLQAYCSALQDLLSILRNDRHAQAQSTTQRSSPPTLPHEHLLTKFTEHQRALVVNIAFRCLYSSAVVHTVQDWQEPPNRREIQLEMPPEWPASLGDHLLRLANKQARHLLDWRNRITHTSTIQDLDAVLEMGPVPGLIDQELIDFLIAARPFVVATAEKNTDEFCDSGNPRFNTWVKIFKDAEAKKERLQREQDEAKAEQIEAERFKKRLHVIEEGRRKQLKYHAALRREYLRGLSDSNSMVCLITCVILTAMFCLHVHYAQAELVKTLQKNMARDDRGGPH